MTVHEVPQPGDIGLTTVDGPVGWLIRLGQRLNRARRQASRFEHAFLVLPGGQLIEAQPGGAVVWPLSDYAGRRVLYVSPSDLSVEQRAAVCTAALRYLGVGYSAATYLALAAHRFHLPVPGLRAYIASSHRMICSELVDQAFQDAGVQLFADGRWPGYVTPADLWELLGRSVSVPGAVIDFPAHWSPDQMARWTAEYKKKAGEGGELR